MPKATQVQELVHVLTQLGWEFEKEVHANGMMAKRATLGHVRRKKDGTLGFVKCIWYPSEGAGEETRNLSAPTRLRRVYSRLEKIRHIEEIPLVPLLELHLAEDVKCLVIIMERVKVLSEVFPGLGRPKLSVEILRRLNPRQVAGGHWVHFDICPANTGVTASGSPVLIDPESLYLLNDVLPENVSCLAAKWPRSPKQWVDEVRAALKEGTSLKDFSLHKHCYEVLLLAAEVSMGERVSPLGNCAEGWLLRWLSELGVRKELTEWVEFWRVEIPRAMNRRQRPDLEGVARMIEDSKLMQSSRSDDARVRTYVTAPSSKSLDTYAQNMRSDLLDEGELRQYLSLLLQEGKVGGGAQPWVEAAVLSLCYLRDRETALSVVNEGVQRHPHDPDLVKWHEMILLWGKDL